MLQNFKAIEHEDWGRDSTHSELWLASPTAPLQLLRIYLSEAPPLKTASISVSSSWLILGRQTRPGASQKSLNNRPRVLF